VANPYIVILRAQLRAQTSYRASFAVDVFSSVWSTVADVATVLVLFRVTTSLGGFSVREAMVIVGVSACAFATADLAAGNLARLRQYVRTGQFDTLLVRPLAALPQLILSDLALRLVGRVVVAAGVLVTALVLAPIEWTPARLGLAVLAPLAGAVFFAAIFVAGATVTFWWVESGEVANSLTYGGRDLTAYPITVYGGLFRRVFGFGLGFGFVAYYPALALLDRPDPLGLPVWFGWVSPAVALVAAVLAGLCWRVGVRHYRSTGS
jgi:ABC-2 type transport system permease protein